MSTTFLTYVFYESATVPAVYVHPHGTRKFRNRLMASRKEDAPAQTKYVWNTIFPNIVRKNIKKPYPNHFELTHRRIGLFLEHFKSPPSLLKSWPRPHKWLQKNLFPPNIAIPNGTRVSAPAPVSAKPRFTKPRAPLVGVCFPSFGITACASFFTIKSPAVMDTQLT